MNGLGRRIRVNSAEENQSGIQVVAGRDFDRFLGGVAVTDQHYVVLKGSDLDRSPGNPLDYACVLLLADYDHVANLKWAICL